MTICGIVFIFLLFGHYFFFVTFIQKSDSDAKFGCIDEKGKIVIKPRFDHISLFSEGLAVFLKGDKAGYINKEGKIVINAVFEHAHPFHEGLAAVSTNGEWGYIDRTGKMVIAARFADADDYHEGLASVKVRGIYGCIDKVGAYVIEPRYNQPLYFADGLALVKMANGKYGYINRSGNVVIEAQFDDAGVFSDELARVSINGKWGFINTKGVVTIEPQFEKILTAFNDGLAMVVLSGRICAIDRSGQAVWKLAEYKSWSWVPSFSEGLAVVWDGKDKYTYIGTNGETAIEIPGATSAGSFSEGLAAIEVNGLWGYINKSGEFAIEPKFLFAEQFHEGLASVRAP